MPEVSLPAAGFTVRLVDRAKMKANGTARRMRAVPEDKKEDRGPLPPVPPTLDLSKSRQIKYPMNGNDRYGDCFYSDACHHVNTWTGQRGTPAFFDPQSIIDAYLRLAGGDNGLSDDQIMGEWKNGLCAGPHKIMDWMVVPDAHTARLAGYLFGGVDFTLAIPNRWLSVAKSGAVWDYKTGDRPNQSNGHAVHLSGHNPDSFNVETWGFPMPITMTDAGLRACDPEFLAEFSLDMFDPATGLAANGHTYDELAGWWHDLGGAQLPPSPFSPTPPPPPPTGKGFTGTMTYGDGVLVGVNAPAGGRFGGINWQQIIAAILALLAAFGITASEEDVTRFLITHLRQQ